MEGLDPVFSTEDRAVALSLSRSRWSRLILSRLYRSRLTLGDLGIALSLLLAVASFRWARTSVEAGGETARQIILAGAAEVSRRLRSASTPDLRRWTPHVRHDGTGRLELADEDRGRRVAAEVDALQLAPENGRAQAAAAGADAARPQFVVRMAEAFNRRLDACLLSFLGYKLVLLVLYTMPVAYGFGLKRRFLYWASRSKLFRMHLRIAPLATFAMVGAGLVTVRFSRRPVQPNVVQRWQVLGLLNVILTYSTSRLFELIRGDPGPLISVEESADDRDLLAQKPPPLWLEEKWTWPLRQLCPPVFLGLEELPAEGRRLLFVGNHTIWAVDTGLLTYGIRARAGIWLRPLGEHAWFALPVVGEMLRSAGAVDGTRHNCDLLMENGENLLVYPGGARESWRRTTDEKYPILWADHHVGFAAMAVRHGYTIVPVASVGTEDVFEPVADLPIDRVMTAWGLIPRPPSGTSKAFDRGALLPLIGLRPRQAQRVYFKIMPPIHTADVKGQEADEALVRRIRDEAKARLQQGIADALKHRESDPERYVFSSARRAACATVAGTAAAPLSCL